MNIIYMGTPDFAVYPLKKLIEAGHNISLVVTQPDKAKGRSKALIPTPVKLAAQEYNIEVLQPEKVKDESVVKKLKSLNPDVIVVAAYGQILPENILNIPTYGCINIHASLLPKYRGAAPIELSILDGEEKTGVTTMYMEKGLDTGDMIDKMEVDITSDDTGETLHDKLAVCGAELIIKTLEKLEAGTAARVKQDDALSSYAPMLTKDMGEIDFNSSAAYIDRQVRALIVWPCAYTKISGKNVKLLKVRIADIDEEKYIDTKPGEIIEITKKNFTIKCGEGAITVLKLLPEGKKPMDTAAYLNGNKLKVGMPVGE
ncbi:MAG: methionyl-tRNA formyltransferase [Lachnospiraceae bacterium]|nr:methionyl-tRNA formyltransferase [Lachnospiraceae bacterium]